MENRVGAGKCLGPIHFPKSDHMINNFFKSILGRAKDFSAHPRMLNQPVLQVDIRKHF